METNLDKDIKVIQLEQKKFAQQFKMKMESFDKGNRHDESYLTLQNKHQFFSSLIFHKATAAVKKNRKKKNNAERELKVDSENIIIIMLLIVTIND